MEGVWKSRQNYIITHTLQKYNSSLLWADIFNNNIVRKHSEARISESGTAFISILSFLSTTRLSTVQNFRKHSNMTLEITSKNTVWTDRTTYLYTFLKTPPLHYFCVKNEPILINLVHRIWKKINTSSYTLVHHIWKLSPHYLAKCRAFLPYQNYVIFRQN